MEIALPPITQRIQIDQSGLAGQVGGVKGAFGKIGGVMGKAVVAGAAAAGVAVGAFAVKGVADAASVEKGLREVNALFGRTGPEGEASFKRLQSGVAGLSGEIGIAQDVLTKGLYQAISAGVPEENVFEFLKVAGKASIAGVTDVETAVDGITTTLNAFGLEATEAESVADSMYATVQGGKTTFGELAASLANVAPAAAASKVSFTEVNAAIATMTSAGIGTAESTTKLRAALDGLQKPSKDLDAIFQALGHDSAQSAIESEGLGFALDAVRDAADGNNGKLQQLLGSSEAVAAANVLAGSGAEKFTAELKRQEGAAGAASGAFEEMQKSTSVQWDKVKVQVQNVGISIGNAILPTLSKILGFVADNLPKAIEAFRRGWATVKPFLQPILDGVKAIFGGVSQLGGAGGSGPLGSFLDLVRSIGATIKRVLGSEGAQATFRGIVDTIKGIAKQIGPIVAGIGDILSGIFRALKWVWDAIGDDVIRVVMAVVGAISSVIGGIVKVVRGIIDVIAGIFTGDWRRVWEGVKSIAAGIWQAIGGIFRGAIGIIKGAFGAIVSLVKGLPRMAWEALKGLGRSIVSQIKRAWEMAKIMFRHGPRILWAILKTMPRRAWEALKDLGSRIGDAIKRAWQVAKVLFKHGPRIAWQIIKTLPGRAFDALKDLGAKIGEKIHQAWATAKVLFRLGIATARALIRELPGKARDALSSLGEKIGNVVAGAWRWVKGKVREGIANVMLLVRELPGRARDALANIGSKLWQSGRNLIQGFIDGILSMVSKVGDAVGNVVSRAREYLPFSPAKRGPLSGSGSPDRAGAAFGTMLAEGIAGQRRTVAEAVGELAAGMEPLALGQLEVRGRGLAAAAGPAAAAGATYATTIAPSYTITAHDVTETARAVREENGYTVAAATRRAA